MHLARPRSLPRDNLAPLVVAALLLTTGVANLLWDLGVPSVSNPVRLDPAVDPFPIIVPSSSLHVVPVPWTANASTRLALTSLQGLVNRGGAQLYLDEDNETGNASSILSFLVSRYGVRYDVVDAAWAYAHYRSMVRGLIVTDPTRPESVNLGTMLATQDDAIVTGPDVALTLHAEYGLPVLLDYASSNWTALDAAGAYDRALHEVYPSCSPDLLAILPPTQVALRDYLIATRTFVFYQPQGVLATPEQLTSTQRVLAAAPRGIPILGWFDSPTLTEENAFVQLASSYGKPIFGSEAVPNLSVLTAYGRNVVRTQPPPPNPPPLANKTYVVVAVPDGDNLDFVAGRMRTLWTEPQRGTFPIAWSLSPLLADLAPPYLDYYYATATPNDRFVLGPSGAGYLYPDYLGPGDLGPYLERTRRYGNETGMDVTWLLNAFVASEIPYDSTTLSAYVDALHPRGLVLDYDDQAKTQDAWMQAGATSAAPVIRSTQLWTTFDNFYAKVGGAMAAWGSGPHFLWATVYTFRFDLADAANMVQGLSARTGGNIVVVTPEQLFTLMQEEFVAEAHAQVASLRANPVTSVVLSPAIEQAQSWLDAPTDPADLPMSAYHAYMAITDLREAGLELAVAVSGLIVVLAAVASLRRMRPAAISIGTVLDASRPLPVCAAAFALFLLATRAALLANFWSYQWIVVGIVLGGLGRPLRRSLDRSYPRLAFPVVAALDLVFVAMSLATNTAFALASIGTVAVVDAVLSREATTSTGSVLSLVLGVAAGFLAPIGPLSFGVFGVMLLLPLAGAPLRPPARPAVAARGSLLRGLVVTLPVAGLMVASNYGVGLRLGLVGGELPAMAAGLLALGPLAGLLLARPWASSRVHELLVGGLATAAVFSATLFVVSGTLATTVVLLALEASLGIAADATLRRARGRRESWSPILTASVSWIPLFLLFFRLPPVTYSLSVVHLPEAIEAALYAPAFLFVPAFAALGLFAFLRMRREPRVAKGYDAWESVPGGRSP